MRETLGDGLISIHAPVWGRAPEIVSAGAEMVISIHAPVWGRAQGNAVRVYTVTVFQFTPPCGGGQQICINAKCCLCAKW